MFLTGAFPLPDNGNTFTIGDPAGQDVTLIGTLTCALEASDPPLTDIVSA